MIPAAGRSSRSGLDYPKCLYRIGGVPIIVRLIRQLARFDANPVVIINPAQEAVFRTHFNEFDCNPSLVFQHEPLGMGNALLQAGGAVQPGSHVLLVWSDIPLLHDHTIASMINCHLAAANDFSFVTMPCESCYTIVQRENGNVKGVIETRAAGLPPGKDAERDIGLFVFRKEPVFGLLKKFEAYTEVNGKKEQGFLYIIEKLAAAGYRVEGYPIAMPQDVLSFNTPQDLAEIEQAYRMMQTAGDSK